MSQKKVIIKLTAQKRLMIAWLVSTCTLLLLFMLVSWQRTSGTTFNDCLQWLLNYISPGLTLMIGTFAYLANQQSSDPPKLIDKTFYLITLYFSLAYLTTLIIIVLLIPISLDETTTVHDHLKKFSLLMTFLQTSLLVFLGIFFTRESR